MDAETPGWPANTVLLLDNATWHNTSEVHDTMARNNMRICYTAPYSFSSSPIELVFARLKRGELNPEKLATGKK